MSNRQRIKGIGIQRHHFTRLYAANSDYKAAERIGLGGTILPHSVIFSDIKRVMSLPVPPQPIPPR
jgi:hypothetical protein